MKARDILKRPIITEKSSLSSARGEYVFQVARQAGKRQIAQAVKETFGVKVKSVRTLKHRGKVKRALRTRTLAQQSDEKRAIVKLAEGEKIAVFETGE